MDKKILITNILPILTYLNLMASAVGGVIEFSRVLKLFIISMFEAIKENEFSGKMECASSFAAVR